eukprot:10214793-Ditylum_brightwellii.AAC.1
MMKAGSLVPDSAMKDSLWYIESGLEPVKVNMNKEGVIQKELFKLSVDDYINILDEISRRETICFELGGSDEIDATEI